MHTHHRPVLALLLLFQSESIPPLFPWLTVRCASSACASWRLTTCAAPPMQPSCRLILVHDPACPSGAAGPGAKFITQETLKWLLAGIAMLSILALGGKRYADGRAAAAAQHMQRLRAVHATDADIAQVRGVLAGRQAGRRAGGRAGGRADRQCCFVLLAAAYQWDAVDSTHARKPPSHPAAVCRPGPALRGRRGGGPPSWGWRCAPACATTGCTEPHRHQRQQRALYLRCYWRSRGRRRQRRGRRRPRGSGHLRCARWRCGASCKVLALCCCNWCCCSAIRPRSTSNQHLQCPFSCPPCTAGLQHRRVSGELLGKFD